MNEKNNYRCYFKILVKEFFNPFMKIFITCEDCLSFNNFFNLRVKYFNI